MGKKPIERKFFSPENLNKGVILHLKNHRNKHPLALGEIRELRKLVKSGVYAIWYNLRLIYIGKSGNIGMRLIQHLNDTSHNSLSTWIKVKGDSLSYSYYRAPRKERKIIEDYLIKYLNPQLNILGKV